MLGFAALFAIDMVFAVLYINYGYPKVTKLSFCYKMLASAVFVLNGAIAYGYSAGSPYAKTVVAGLVFGFVGDAFLAIDPFLNDRLREKKAIFGVIGAAFFFVGHILYIIAFVLEIRKEQAVRFPVFIIAWVLMLGSGIAVKIALKVKLGKFAVPVLIYAVALVAMCSFGICLALNRTGEPFTRFILIAGPLCFVFSDATIVLRMFYKDKYETLPMRYANLLTYFISQMFFGISIMLIK